MININRYCTKTAIKQEDCIHIFYDKYQQILYENHNVLAFSKDLVKDKYQQILYENPLKQVSRSMVNRDKYQQILYENLS